MEQQDQQNKKPKIALCTEFGGGQWRMLFLDTLEECRVRFPGAKQGKWFEQSEDGNWKQVEPKELADFEVRLDELDEWCCLKIRMPINFPQRFGFMNQHGNGPNSDTFISSINPLISGTVHVDIGDRKRQNVLYWAYVSLTSFNALIAEDGGGSNVQWSIRSEADILGPYEHLDQQQGAEQMKNVENVRKSSAEPEATMKIQPYQPSWIGIGQEEQANQQQMMENAAPTDQNKNEDARPKKSKSPAELEEKQQEALVFCWKQSSEDSFLCEWNQTTKQFMFNRRFQASNKRLNDAELDIQLGDWYQIRFVKYKKSDVHISILECEEILLDAPLDRSIQDSIIQLFPNVKAVNSILKQMTKENQQQGGFPGTRGKEGKCSDFSSLNFDKLSMNPISANFGGTVQQRPLSRAKPIQSRQQEVQGWTKRRPEDVYSESEPPDDDDKIHHVPRSLNTVQPFALSTLDSTRKRSMASSRSYTPARLTPIQKAAAPKTYRQLLDVPKKYRTDLNIHDYVPVEEKHIPRFLHANAQMLREIQKEHPNCKIYLDRDNKCFRLEAKKTADVDAAKRRIQEILDAMNVITRKVSILSNAQRSLISAHFGEMLNKFSVKCHFENNQLVMVGNDEAKLEATRRALLALRPYTKRLEVLREYRQQLMANEEKKLNELEWKFNVDIDVQEPQDGQRLVQLFVIGAEQMVARCVKFMREDMPTSKLVKVPHEFRDHFLGNGGKLVQQMQKQHGVQIQFAHSNNVAVVGETAHVDTCILAIQQKVREIQAEKNLALSRATTSYVRAVASMAGSNGIQRTASAATGFQSRGNSSPMMRSEWRH